MQGNAPHKLFFKACYNLSCLGIEYPLNLLEKYSSNGSVLRTILSMIYAAYVAKKYNLVKDINICDYVSDMLKSGNITENLFDAETMTKIRNITIKNKQNLTE